MIRKDVYKGKTEEELKKMSLEEFAQLIKARPRRALKRLDKNMKFKKLVEKVRRLKKKLGNKIYQKVIKTHVREAVIIPEWLGLTFGVYNGKEFVPVKITIQKLGKRLGDFSHTTKPVKHSGPGIGATRGSKYLAAK